MLQVKCVHGFRVRLDAFICNNKYRMPTWMRSSALSMHGPSPSTSDHRLMPQFFIYDWAMASALNAISSADAARMYAAHLVRSTDAHRLATGSTTLHTRQG